MARPERRITINAVLVGKLEIERVAAVASTAIMLVICETRRRTALGERERSRRRASFSKKRGWEEMRMLELGAVIAAVECEVL